MKLFLLTNLIVLLLFSCSTAQKKESAGQGGGDRHELSNYYDEGDNDKMAESYSEKRDHLSSLAKECREGDGDSCYRAGSIYFQGRENEKSYKKAGKYFFEACKLDHARGCYVLGMMFNNAVGTKRNCKKADDFFMRGCELDDENACVYLWECDESKEKGRFYFSEDEKDEDYDRSDSYDEFTEYSDW
ncbi:MAG TPA: tetratricopeptide repeat protein [bacterium]|nr:tetratricopeptide repeat protein [bacterium]